MRLTPTKKSVTQGVSQGSILGPILILIFINYFPDSIEFFKFISMFADDSSLLCKFDHSNTSLIHTAISQNLTKVFVWLTENKIKINVDKCKFIIIFFVWKKVDSTTAGLWGWKYNGNR